MQRSQNKQSYKPWIPPPAKTSKKSKRPINKFSVTAISSKECQGQLKPTSLTSLSNLPEHKILASGDPCKSDISVGGRSSEGISGKKNDSSHVSSVANLPSITVIKNLTHDKQSEELYASLQRLKNNLSHVRPACVSLKDASRILHKCAFATVMDDVVINHIIVQADQHVQMFFEVIEEFENHIASSELVAKNDIDELIAHLQVASETKELLFSKLVEVYDNVMSALKFLIEAIQEKHVSSVLSVNEAVQETLDDVQDTLLTCREENQKLKTELSLAEDKIHTLEMQKGALEQAHSFYDMELSRRDAKIERLELQLQTSKREITGIAENERLIEIIEELKKQMEQEKAALKKVLRIQKTKAEQSVLAAEELQRKLSEKSQELFDLAANRDQWKIQVTNIKNQLVEAESKVEHLKLKNFDLQKQLDEKLEEHTKKLSELKSQVEEKSSVLAVTSEENEKLKEMIKSTEHKCADSETEVKEIRHKYAELEARLLAVTKNTENMKKDSENELQIVIPLLQELKDSLAVIKENSLPTSTKRPSLPNDKSTTLNEKDLFSLVKEIKDLIETKEVRQYSVEENQKNLQIASVERRLQDLQEKYDKEIAEKQKLYEKLEEKNTSTIVKSPLVENQYLDVDLRILSVENKMKILHLEEELKNKSLVLASLERQKSETENRLASQVRELQSDLDRVTRNYESLQKYVNMLKSSYANVFGTS